MLANVALAVSLALGGTSAVTALGLGEIVQQSALGEPFRVAIPVLFNADDLAGDELAPECFKLVSSESQRSAELPQMRFGRAALERSAAGFYVVVTSNVAADDPVLSFTVQAGCKLRIRHEYTVLLDPPIIIREPVGEASPSAIAPARPPQLRPLASGAAGTTPSGARTRPSSGAASAPRRAQKTARPAAGGKAPVVRAAATAREETKPQLRVSHGNEDASGGAADIARGKSDEEIRRDVEAETIVLQRRVAELSATLERMQAELREATAAREIAERTAKASRPAGWEPNPWLVSLILLVVILAVAVVLARMRRSSPLLIDLGPTTIADAGAFEPARPVDEPHAKVATPGHVAATLAAGDAEDDVRRAHSVAPNPMTDQDSAFDDDLLRYAEQTSGHSVLEREHPKVVASVIRDWGKPKVIAYLRELLVSPRKAMGAFSREAVSDLMLLQGIAMERAGYQADENPWQVEIDSRRAREA